MLFSLGHCEKAEALIANTERLITNTEGLIMTTAYEVSSINESIQFSLYAERILRHLEMWILVGLWPQASLRHFHLSFVRFIEKLDAASFYVSHLLLHVPPELKYRACLLGVAAKRCPPEVNSSSASFYL